MSGCVQYFHALSYLPRHPLFYLAEAGPCFRCELSPCFLLIPLYSSFWTGNVSLYSISGHFTLPCYFRHACVTMFSKSWNGWLFYFYEYCSLTEPNIPLWWNFFRYGNLPHLTPICLVYFLFVCLPLHTTSLTCRFSFWIAIDKTFQTLQLSFHSNTRSLHIQSSVGVYKKKID